MNGTENIVIKKPYVPVVTTAECRRVFLEEILYIESTYRKVEIRTLKGRYSFYDKIENLEKYLDDRFFHCLKHLIVNFDMVVCMKAGEVHLYGGDVLLIGQHNFVKAKQKYAYYIRRPQPGAAKVAESTKTFNAQP